MSLVADSLVRSSSFDDFAAFIDGVLDSHSSDLSPEQEVKVDFRFKKRKEERMKRHKVEEPRVLYTESSIKTNICAHYGSFGGLCIECGQLVDENSGVTFKYIHKKLRFTHEEIARVRDRDMKNLSRDKKLHLILDLDHTLLNSSALESLTSKEEYLRSQSDSLQGSLFVLNSISTITKLRPFVHTFLKEASKMFEMYIYTMGDSFYASEMAKLLDPQRKYFSSKVISRDESTKTYQKALDVVPADESAIVILDDKECAWPNNKDNLIVMERYHYFASSCKEFRLSGKSLSEMRVDESELDAALAAVLKVLKQIYNTFFDELGDDIACRNVRQVLKTIRKDILNGCKIVFSHVFPSEFEAADHHLWKMAEQFGATCSTVVDPSVTHVISTNSVTVKSCWAVKENKFLVNPRWLETTYYLWKRQAEENFPVNNVKNPI